MAIFRPAPEPLKGKPGAVLWFHASSEGELEGLRPLIEAFKGPKVVTVFSASAHAAVLKLAGASDVVAVGFSPQEGQWREALEAMRPRHLVTLKYEAWPDLWASLSELNIGLTIVGAELRSSLRWAARILKLLGVKPPRIEAIAYEPARMPVEDDVLKAQWRVIPDPRWWRVGTRLTQPSERAQQVSQAIRKLPQPVVFLSQVWPEEEELLRGALGAVAGSLVVVPHNLTPGFIDQIEHSAQEQGWNVARSSQNQPAPQARACFIVDEKGILAELYPEASRVYVGGGWSKGVHSTLEPALTGVQIACGTKRADRFTEIAELESLGQLTRMQTQAQVVQWLTESSDTAQKKRADHWRASKVEAGEKIWRQWLDAFGRDNLSS